MSSTATASCGVSLQWAAPEWNNILYFTNSLNGLAEDYKHQLAYQFNSTGSVYVGYLKAPAASSATLKTVIGAGGHWLKTTTAQQGLYFIWHDKNIETFLVWGPHASSVERGLQALAWRLNKYKAAVPAVPVPAPSVFSPIFVPITPPPVPTADDERNFTTPSPQPADAELEYDPRVCAPLKKNPLRRTPSPTTQLKVSALSELFLTRDEIEPLTSLEINMLYTALCEPPPTYSDADLDNFCQFTQLLPVKMEHKLNVKHLPLINILDFALTQSSAHLLQLLLFHVDFEDSTIASYVYILYTHYSSNRLTATPPTIYELGFERLLRLLVNYGKNDSAFMPILHSWALNGVREEITYKMSDFHNYISPNLALTKQLVPLYFSPEESIKCYYDFEASTYSCNGCSESTFPYDKSTEILTYLESLL
jgi:hypothetical protein